MTDGATIVFFPSIFSTFPVDFPKIFFQIKPCPDNYEQNKDLYTYCGIGIQIKLKV